MKRLILKFKQFVTYAILFISPFMFGCTTTPEVKTEYVYIESDCPTMGLSTFEIIKEKEYNAVKKDNLICLKKDDFLDLVKSAKTSKEEHNRLLMNIKEFNENVKKSFTFPLNVLL